MIPSNKSKKLQLNRLEAYQLALKTLNELYTTEEGKKFVHHLIYSFTAEEFRHIPFSKTQLFDCLTHAVINPVGSKDNPIKDENILSLHSEFKKSSEEDKPAIKAKLDAAIWEYLSSHPVDRLACCTSLTNKLLGLEELQALLDFIQTRIDEGNEVICKMIRYVKYKNQPKPVKKEKKTSDKPKSKKLGKSNKVKETPKEVDTRAKAALGSDTEMASLLESYAKSLK